MGEQEKRLSQVLGPYWKVIPDLKLVGWELNMEALAKDAIIVPVRIVHDVEHMEENLGAIEYGTWLLFDSGIIFIDSKFVGKDGPAVAIILPYRKGEDFGEIKEGDF